MSEPRNFRSATRVLAPELIQLLNSLKPGQKIRITRDVHMNSRHKWSAQPIEGTFSHVNYLTTGIATDRVPEDDIVVVAVHFRKDNLNELSSITLDPYTKIEAI